MSDIRILEYVDPQGRSPFELWFNSLNAVASAKVTGALYQLSAGNWSNVKEVGAGVFERKLDVGPGYRLYFGKDGDMLVIVLGGGNKKRQQVAINMARERWADYRRRKQAGER